MNTSIFSRPFAVIALVAGLVFAPIGKAAESFGFDSSHTSVLFFINHFGFSEVSGKFLKYDGALEFDRKDPTKSKVNITIDVNSIDMGMTKFNEHLLSKDFFDAEKFPTMTFKSGQIKKAGKNKFKMTGDFTLHGVTKPVTLDVTLNKAADNPFTKKPALGFQITGSIKRSEFGMSAYVPNVADLVNIRIDTELHAK